jgi:hypothetical protein
MLAGADEDEFRVGREKAKGHVCPKQVASQIKGITSKQIQPAPSLSPPKTKRHSQRTLGPYFLDADLIGVPSG